MTVLDLQNKERGHVVPPFDSEHHPLGGLVEVFDMCSTLLSPTWTWKERAENCMVACRNKGRFAGVGGLGSRKRRVGVVLLCGANLILKKERKN